MPSCPKRALEAGASDPVAAADPVACGSQRLHSSLGAEGAIVPGGGWWGQWGVCTQKERMRLEKLPPGLQSPGPPPDLHRDPFTTPIPFPHQLPAAFARLLRVGTAGAGGSLAPPLRLPPESFSGSGSCPAPRVLTGRLFAWTLWDKRVLERTRKIPTLAETTDHTWPGSA